MNSRTTVEFRERLARLPASVRDQARKAYALFAADPQHPSLRLKKVHASLPIYSARVSRGHRAVGVLRSDEIVRFWIGTHADYDRLLQVM